MMQTLKKNAKEMADFSLQRHYPVNMIKRLLTKSDPFSNNKHCSPTAKQPLKRPITSLLYHPSTIHMHKIILLNWSLLHTLRWLRALANHHCLHTNETNIQDMLARSKLWQPATRTPGMTTCNNRKRKTCTFICAATNTEGPKPKLNTTEQFNCQTYNSVFIIPSIKRANLDIGKTGCILDTYFKENLADIKHHKGKLVANHFKQAGHCIHNVCVKGLWLLFMDNASDRKDMESHLD